MWYVVMYDEGLPDDGADALIVTAEESLFAPRIVQVTRVPSPQHQQLMSCPGIAFAPRVVRGCGRPRFGDRTFGWRVRTHRLAPHRSGTQACRVGRVRARHLVARCS